MGGVRVFVKLGSCGFLAQRKKFFSSGGGPGGNWRGQNGYEGKGKFKEVQKYLVGEGRRVVGGGRRGERDRGRKRSYSEVWVSQQGRFDFLSWGLRMGRVCG